MSATIVAICKRCGQNMADPGTLSCLDSDIVIRYGDESPRFHGERCHDCAVALGGTHHARCDVERCPVCHGQKITCGCNGCEEAMRL